MSSTNLIIGDNSGYEVHDAAGINLETTKSFIITDHPHPYVIAIIVFLFLIVIYYLYVMFIKSSFTGDWACIEREYGKISIDHNTVVDQCVAQMRGPHTKKFNGYVAGNSIHLKVGDEMVSGALNDNKIYWNNGETWIRTRSMI